jgi:hypothetical protein
MALKVYHIGTPRSLIVGTMQKMRLFLRMGFLPGSTFFLVEVVVGE